MIILLTKRVLSTKAGVNKSGKLARWKDRIGVYDVLSKWLTIIGAMHIPAFPLG